MKSYNHLYEKFISDDNIRAAIGTALKGKKLTKSCYIGRTKTTVADIKNHPDKYIGDIRDYAEHFRNRRHRPVEIYDGISRKRRTIIVPTIEEQIVHHMAVNVVKPFMLREMYEHSYGSIPKRGMTGGAKTIKRWIRRGDHDVDYCLKMDVRHFFETIDHSIIKQMLTNKIHDKQMLTVLHTIIDATGSGLPLGFYTSQWLANYYLTGLDHYIVEELRPAHYIRYMDDMVCFDSDKQKLHEIRKKIAEYLENKLMLTMKDDWQVFRFHASDGGGRFLDFMGYRFYRNRTTMRKSIMLKMCRKARRIWRKAKPSIYECKQVLSYIGWLKHTDTYNVYLERVQPLICIRQIKRRISIHDRRLRNDLENGRINGTPVSGGYDILPGVSLHPQGC